MIDFDGLGQHEIVAMAVIAENLDYPEDYVTAYQIKRDMAQNGFTKIAATLAIKSLVTKELLTYEKRFDEHGEAYTAYELTNNGWAWILQNQERFLLTVPADEPNSDVPF